jgi:hypothetical protein
MLDVNAKKNTLAVALDQEVDQDLIVVLDQEVDQGLKVVQVLNQKVVQILKNQDVVVIIVEEEHAIVIVKKKITKTQKAIR